MKSDLEDWSSKYKNFQEYDDESFLRKFEHNINDEIAFFRETINKENAKKEREFLNLFGASSEDEMLVFSEPTEEISVPVEKLECETEDPFQQKLLEARMSVFTRESISSREERKTYDPEIMTPKERKWEEPKENVWQSPSKTNWSPGISAEVSTNTTNTANQNQNHIFSQVQRLQKNVESLAFRTPPFKEPKQVTGWGERKKTFWEKCKDFVGSQKFRVVSKLGAIISLQLFSAHLAGKYKIDNAKQFVGVVGLMIGTFLLSKELQADGFDNLKNGGLGLDI